MVIIHMEKQLLFYDFLLSHGLDSLFQLQSFNVEDMKQDYDTGEDGTCMITFKVDFDRVDELEVAIRENCSRNIVFYKR